MRTLIIPDVHGRSTWEDMVSQFNPQPNDEVVFLGDYFDSHGDIAPVVQIHNFRAIQDFRTSFMASGGVVTLLVGNHDYHYLPEISEYYSGFSAGAASAITMILQEFRGTLQMAYRRGKYLFSHAGIDEAFLNRVLPRWSELTYAGSSISIVAGLNDLFVFQPLVFGFYGRDDHGDDMGQSCIWIRPRSLMRGSQELKRFFIQIVGHTQQRVIDFEGKSTGGRYFFVDTMGTSREYLVIEKDDSLSLHKL